MQISFQSTGEVSVATLPPPPAIGWDTSGIQGASASVGKVLDGLDGAFIEQASDVAGAGASVGRFPRRWTSLASPSGCEPLFASPEVSVVTLPPPPANGYDASGIECTTVPTSRPTTTPPRRLFLQRISCAPANPLRLFPMRRQEHQARANKHANPTATIRIYEEDDLASVLAEEEQPLVLVLDCIQDPHNLGACLRTADAAGCDLVVMPKDKTALSLRYRDPCRLWRCGERCPSPG